MGRNDRKSILIGDINSDYAKTTLDVHTRTLQFISSVYQLGQLIKEPTRVTKSSATAIDLIFTNMVDKIATSGVDSSWDFMRYESLLCPKLDPLLKRFEISNILSKWTLLMTLKGSRGKMLNVLMTLT